MPPPALPAIRHPSGLQKPPLPAIRKPTMDDGVARMLETGNLSADVDLEEFFNKEGVFKAVKAPVHPVKERQLPRVMTKTSSYARYNGVLLDIEDIRKIPPKLNLQDLREWENGVDDDDDASDVTSSLYGTVLKNAGEIMTHLQAPQRNDTRTYVELLDEYSMHEFIIRKGMTLRNTPEFASFKRRYNSCWGNIEHIVVKLENFLKMYNVELAFVDGRKVAELAAFQVDDILKREDLLQCFANHEEVEEMTANVSQLYAAADSGRKLAVEKIQATWRMYQQRIAYRHLLDGKKAATTVQRAWTLYRLHCTTRKTIKALRETRLLRWKHTMEEFIRKWPKIRDGPRRIIHVPSLSYPRFHAKHVPFYLLFQMGQIIRVSDLKDPNVEIILIVPMRPEPEILEYYYSMLASAGVPDVKSRLTLLVPEEAKRLPGVLSLTRLMLLSSRLMKCLASASKGRDTYIVPGVVGAEELSLATELNVPMLSADPNIAQAFGTKSGGRRLMDLAAVPAPPGAHGLNDRNDLLSALALLMVNYREVSRWLVKLDTESGSRGHAYFDVNRIHVMAGVDESKKTYENVLAELKQHAGKRARLLNPLSYSDWEAYLNMFDVVGGCVEAVPNRIKTSLTANLFVEPSGVVAVNSVVEPMLAPAFTVIGCQYPFSKVVPYAAVRDAALALAKAAYHKGIMGYMSVDFVVTDVSENSLPRLYAVDVDLCLTNNAAAHSFACLVAGCEWNAEEGTCLFRGTANSLSYAYSGLIYSPLLASVRHKSFFTLCHRKGLTFDSQLQSGIVYHLLSIITCGCVGVLSLGTQRNVVARKMKEFQSLLNLELPKQGEHTGESNIMYFYSATHQLVRSVQVSEMK
ncbi:hypothetical protein, conserved [Trypanosoma brucei gambiense DAL972]|uniref:IQCH-like ATP-grasp domain-containing protein n=1 Tax=Trypanosoma brucei gambiense (strain MHOM/CI/86/DAL972) TaxID=679716 RepID=C9ZKR2_TRYB9|nr:hypothetical protein, conserved [Trypanosoma brucei gambiense DAL972]CBH10278.1 hypothetical protein, conserved [Trypanosoma brucei gambiense DAL972]|eukprot:XP_011772568.1 hypothetical protein, conserved [Trypanosoma brucei gambiense DAL972]